MTTISTALRDKTTNLGAGPSTLPTEVLLEAAQGIVDYKGTGMGITELSHRSSTFKQLLTQAEDDLRALLDVPDEYAVLFMQGGGTEQFSATLLNMLAVHAARNPGAREAPPVDYVVSGAWSAKALKEAKRLTPRVNVACDIRSAICDPDAHIPEPASWSLSEAPAMLYYCDNETIDGFEFPHDFVARLPASYRAQVPIVADCSSNVLSRPIDVRAHAALFFGAQKNIGPSGVTVVIVRRELVVDPDAVRTPYPPVIPTTLVYKNAMDNGSLYNTPPMFPLYVSALVFAKLRKDGGVAGAQKRALEKSSAVYNALAAHPKRFRPTVAHPAFRSKMNITFRILDEHTGEPSEEAETQFIKLCGEHRIEQVAGHRSVGGLRTSLYNASTLEQAHTLAALLTQFAG
ncbi:phosphoserine transaminase [Malassezia vespertilionis]|uniref:phosphoserine transaminase n=1 Tax=Malassezia vespertilionis TaxID=2020962 RepID=A0A2N1JAV1_9BASI|nr:phosphoserine transaminase [Malassezia vespertilionis]PKI83676.1 Ser1p [Malassezia vespertilionis]WFD07371.1 phosphoserine transaminase [Malassezia vespertilionis]